MKKIFITRITGMIGSHFSELLRMKGYLVCGIARFSAASRLDIEQNNKYLIRCDILDKNALEVIIQDITPDLVLHFAA